MVAPQFGLFASMAVLSPLDKDDVESDVFEETIFTYTAVLDERNLSFDIHTPSPESSEQDIPKEQGPLQIHPLKLPEAYPVNICNQLLDSSSVHMASTILLTHKDASDCSTDNIGDSPDNVDDGGDIVIHPLLPDSTANELSLEEFAKLGPPEQTSNETETSEVQDPEEILPNRPKTHQEISKAIAARIGKQDKPEKLQHQKKKKKKKKKDPTKDAKPGDRKDLGTPPCSGCDSYRHGDIQCYSPHKLYKPSTCEGAISSLFLRQ